MNILFISSWYPSKVHPRDGNFIQKHARCLAREHNIWVIHVTEGPSLSFGETEVYTEESPLGNELIVYYGISKYFSALGRMFSRIRAWAKAYQMLKVQRINFHLAHTHVILYGGLLALYLKLIKGLPYVVTEHSTIYQPDEPLSFGQKAISYLVGHFAAAVLPVSNDLKDRMQQLGIPGPYKVVPNVVDTSIFNLDGKKKKEERVFRFIHISDFSSRKNITGILRAVQQLSYIRTDFSLTLAGDGLIEDMEKLVRDNEVAPFVHLHGPMNEKEVANMMKLHNAFILFSIKENLPCVLLEAQACGLPIIATETGGIKEIVEDERFGILVPSNDEAALTKAMADIINNFAKFSPTIIHERASELYSEKRIRQKFNEAYEAAKA